VGERELIKKLSCESPRHELNENKTRTKSPVQRGENESILLKDYPVNLPDMNNAYNINRIHNTGQRGENESRIIISPLL